MKTLKIIFILLMSLTLFSCHENDDPLIGIWEDNIKLSQKNVEFNSEENSIKITTEGKWWWVIGLKFNGEDVEVDEKKLWDKEFVIETAEFKVERKNEQEIYIHMSENKTNKDRVLIINLEAGDYFDAIKTVQKK